MNTCINSCEFTREPYPVPDTNGRSLYPFSDQKGAKTLPGLWGGTTGNPSSKYKRRHCCVTLWQAKCSNIRLILYVVLYYEFNYAFNIQLIFHIQSVIQYSTFHSTFNYSFYMQFLIHPFNYLIQQFQQFIQHSTLIFKTFNYPFNIQLFIQLF